MITIYRDGLEIEGTVDYDPGQPYPTASCAGSPEVMDASLDGIALVDVDEFLDSDILCDIGDERGWSEYILTVVEAYHRYAKHLHPVVEEHLRSCWRDRFEYDLMESYGG